LAGCLLKSPDGDMPFSLHLIGTYRKNVLKVDWISSRQANDELLQANCYLCELDFRLQLSHLKERKKTSQYFTSALAVGRTVSFVSCKLLAGI